MSAEWYGIMWNSPDDVAVNMYVFPTMRGDVYEIDMVKDGSNVRRFKLHSSDLPTSLNDINGWTVGFVYSARRLVLQHSTGSFPAYGCLRMA